MFGDFLRYKKHSSDDQGFFKRKDRERVFHTESSHFFRTSEIFGRDLVGLYRSVLGDRERINADTYHEGDEGYSRVEVAARESLFQRGVADIQQDIHNVAKTCDRSSLEVDISLFFEDALADCPQLEHLFEELLGRPVDQLIIPVNDEDEDFISFLMNRHGISREEAMRKSVVGWLAGCLESEYADPQGFRLSEEDLMMILSNHVDHQKEACLLRIQAAELHKKKFVESFHASGIWRYWGVPWEDIVRRIEYIQVKVFDVMIGHLGDKYGDFLPGTQTIRVSLQCPLGLLSSVVYHEMLHALSGQIEAQVTFDLDNDNDEDIDVETEQDDDFEDDDSFSVYEVKRVGFRMGRRFGWLNEGVTELLTWEILGQEKDNEVYFEEVKLVSYLLGECGVPKELLVGAYAEHYLKPEGGGARMPKMRALFRFVHAHVHPRFLIDIDDYIRLAGNGTKENYRRAVRNVARLTFELDRDEFVDRLRDAVSYLKERAS